MEESRAYPETPATLSSFRISVGGRTISLSMADSIVIGCPSSSISSTSYGVVSFPPELGLQRFGKLTM